MKEEDLLHHNAPLVLYSLLSSSIIISFWALIVFRENFSQHYLLLLQVQLYASCINQNIGFYVVLSFIEMIILEHTKMENKLRSVQKDGAE